MFLVQNQEIVLGGSRECEGYSGAKDSGKQRIAATNTFLVQPQVPAISSAVLPCRP